MSATLHQQTERDGVGSARARGRLDHCEITEARALEPEASELSAIFASIILNMRRRLDREKRERK